ncbi:SCP2 sterol-binding domain-containing protein [Saccharothrix deserti]|uniref:SCP2 sterol-binding domain-containing protein n=1 Tax=Saccharothrix deserti TaxID=2593674 RepID=UPI00131C9B72|nr:SCP2 sterol-binding domain-containing protein [Saccharothrix deserti]
MAVFASAEELYALFVPFLEQVSQGHLKKKFLSIKASFKVHNTDPDSIVFMDCTQDPPVVKVGDAAAAEQADIELTMSADDSHQFWLGRLNVTKAMAGRRVKFSGPLMKLIGMLPAFQPAFAEYREYLVTNGHEALLQKQ